MTMRDRGFWLYLIFLALFIFGIVWCILVADYHLGFELRSEFVVMDTGESSISLQ